MIDVPVSVLELAGVRAGGTSADALADMIAMARAADDLGAARFWIAEHHNMPSVAATTPPVLAAAVAMRTDRIRVGSGGVMLPNHSPYVVAEQFAALEALAPGRIDVGLGRAPGADPVTAWALRRTQEGLGPDEFPQHVDLVRSWLSTRGVKVGDQGIRLSATPAASGYPELWLLGSSDFSARLAGQMGIRYAYAGHFGQLDPAYILDLYRSEFRPSEELSAPWAMVATSAVVGATEAEAWRLAGPALVLWMGIRTNRMEPIVSPDEADRRLAGWDRLEIGGVRHVGTADQVNSALANLVTACGAQELMVSTTAYDVATRVDTLAAVLAARPAAAR